jgi:hypothetical protein
VRLTDFWERLDLLLGPTYARSWAQDYVLAELGGLTVNEALAAGWDTKSVWLAIYRELQLPPSAR